MSNFQIYFFLLYEIVWDYIFHHIYFLQFYHRLPFIYSFFKLLTFYYIKSNQNSADIIHLVGQIDFVKESSIPVGHMHF